MNFVSPSSRLVATTLVIAAVAVILLATRRATVLVADVPPIPPASAIATPSPSGLESLSGSFGASISATELPKATTTPTRKTAEPTQALVDCKPTDQDRYVYNPDRLQVGAACVHVSGTVEAVRREADGDLHMLLALDPQYVGLLKPSNQGEELGDLVIEPVCVKSVTQLDAEAICAADPDPLSPPFPVVGQRVWMEGRYVFDLEHGGWAELHPLYRWANE